MNLVLLARKRHWCFGRNLPPEKEAMTALRARSLSRLQSNCQVDRLEVLGLLESSRMIWSMIRPGEFLPNPS